MFSVLILLLPEHWRLSANDFPSVVSAASFAPGALAPLEIVTMFGNNLAAAPVASFAPLPPPILGGVTVTVTDSSGKSAAAPLYYVSPNQINLEIPDGTAIGAGSLTLTRSDGTTVHVTVQFANTAPGVFQLNASALAAAQVVQSVNGENHFAQVYQLGPSNTIVPQPIDLSQGQAYLAIYGTGIRSATNVTATVGELPVPVVYRGAQDIYAGEDQVNVGPLPQSLAGRGAVDIVLTVDGQKANATNVTFK